MNSEDPLLDVGVLGWLAELGYRPSAIEPLTGDVSARRYVRVRSARRSLVVAVYPPAMVAACARFRTTTRLLGEAGVRVPEILASDCGHGWMVLEDLGSVTLYDRAGSSWDRLRGHLVEALEAAGRMARLPRDQVAALNPELDAALMKRELEQTWQSFLAPRKLIGGSAVAAALRSSLVVLCERLGESPSVPCHRDFMARNLMLLDRDGLAVLDHQDLRLGPRFYDQASLLNDSLYPPPELEADLLSDLIGSDGEMMSYRRAAAQRTLKAVGTFAVFAERGHPRHLGLIPPTLARALYNLRVIPETAAATARVADRWREFADRAIC